MKLVYTKLSQFSLFGIKIFQWRTDYVERSTDKDTDEDDLYIDLTDRTINYKNED